MKRHNLAWQAGGLLLCVAFQSTMAEDLPLKEQASGVDQALRAIGLSVGNGQSKERKRNGYYATFEKSGSEWRLAAVDTAPATLKDYSNSEILFFTKDLSLVDPNYVIGQTNAKTGQFTCFTGALRPGSSQYYDPCHSSLTSTTDAKLGTQAALAVASLGLSLLTATSMREVGVDKEKVLALIQQTDVLDRLKQLKRDEELAEYRQAFQKAKSASALKAFIDRYSSNDPDGLVPQAIEKREIVKGSDYRNGFAVAKTSMALDVLIQQYQDNDPDNLIPKAIQRRDQLRIEEQRAEVERRQRQAAESELMRQQEAERYRQKQIALRKIGTQVCKSIDGVWNKPTVIYTSTGRVTQPIPGTITVVGFTEGTSGSRVKILTRAVRHTTRDGESRSLDSYTDNNGGKIVPDSVFWDDISNWTPCSP